MRTKKGELAWARQLSVSPPFGSPAHGPGLVTVDDILKLPGVLEVHDATDHRLRIVHTHDCDTALIRDNISISICLEFESVERENYDHAAIY